MVNIPQLFIPLKKEFKKYSNRYFGGGGKDKNKVKDLLPYYLSLQEFYEFICKEVEEVEQNLLELYTKNGRDIEYVEDIGLKVRLIKEYGKIFDVSKIRPEDTMEIRKRRMMEVNK